MPAWRKPPKLLVYVACVVVILHLFGVVYLRSPRAGAVLGNSLQIFSSFLAAAMCFRAARRSPAFGYAFWLLVGCGMGVWGIADLGWSYYEIVRLTEPPPGSLIRFLFDTHGMFFVIALILNHERRDKRIDLPEALDFFQIGILFFLIYFGAYFIPSVSMTPAQALAREFTVMSIGEAAILLLALIQWFRCGTPQVRRLYGGLALFVLLYGSCSTLAQYSQLFQETPTGSWSDLLWSLPLLYGAFWASSWEPLPEAAAEKKRRSTSVFEILLNNLLFIVAPLIVLVQVAQLGPNWKFIRFSLLGISFVCYALRIAVTQSRQLQNEEMVHRQTQAMDSSVEGIGIIKEGGEHVYANAALASMLGLESTEEILGKPWRKVYTPRTTELLEPEVRKALSLSGNWTGSLTIHRADGSRLPVEMYVARIPESGTVCVLRDLSQRQKSELARAEAEAKYRMLVEQVNAITYIAEIGIHGQWFYASPQIEAILGYTPDEWLAIAQNWDTLIHPDDLEGVVAAEERSRKGLPFQAEYRIRRKDGKEIWLSDTGAVVQGSDSHPVMEGILVDITDRKALETQLQQSRKLEAIGRLAGGIAHDFNNLLTIISGYTELALSRPNLPREVHGDIERIDNAAARAAALVRQLLAFSRKQVLQPKVLDLNKIVIGLDSLLRRLMDERIEMVTSVSDGIGRVKADPAQLEQVIMNLVVNARDAMPNGGRLTIETSNVDLDSAYAMDHVPVKPGRYVMLAVSDTGVGMDQQTVAQIFEPFFTTKEGGRGTGLGLSTVYGIVKQSGGYVWVYSEPGKGSTFKVYLPHAVEPAEEAAPALASLPEHRGSETILVVEDEEAVLELIQEVLSEKGYHVIPADTPDHAEEIAANYNGELHLLLTDVIMPRTSGRELASRVAERRPGIRVLFMSGYTDNVITTGGMLEKGLAFLQKPFSPAALLQKVREVLTQTPTL